MRIVTGSLALCVIAVSFAACLPAERPDVSFVIRSCDGSPAGVAKHNECLYFDASDSHAFTGKPVFTWSATASWVTNGGAVVTEDLAEVTTSGGNQAVTPQRLWFARELHPVTTVTVKATVKDGIGLTRAATRDLVLTNARPVFTSGASFVRARASDAVLSPFAVLHLPITDDDGDFQALDVTQLSPAPAPFSTLQVVRCSDVPTRLTDHKNPGVRFPDLSDGDSNALCVSVAALDDLATPTIDESCSTSTADFSKCMASPLFENDPRQFKLRIKVREEGVEPPETTPGTNCIPRLDAQGLPTEVVGCVTLQVSDVLWTASSTSVDAGNVTRVAGGWRRVRPPGIVVRNGLGATDDPSGSATLAGSLDYCSLQTYCPGALVRFAPGMNEAADEGLGQIEDVRYSGFGPSGTPGYWIAAISLDSNGNPGARSGGPSIPAGIPYDVFVPSALLQTNQAIDLSSVSSSAFSYLTGLAQADGTVEIPHTLVPAADGALWVATSAFCPHYDSIGGTCNVANGALPARIVRRLRRVPTAQPALGTTLDVGTLTNVEPAPALAPPGFGQALETIAADGFGGVYAITSDATVTPLDSKIYHLDSTGTVDRAPVDEPGAYLSGIAWSPGANGKERLWIADQATASITRIEDPVGAATKSIVPGIFTLPQAFRLDQVNNLWVDDHLDNFTRRIVFISSDASTSQELEPFSSTGRGFALGVAVESGVWHGDSLDAVRQPVGDSIEVPANARGPIGSTLAGIDPTDGGVYGYSPYVENSTNLFRVEADGTFEPLLALASLGNGTPNAPACGAVQPGLPAGLVGSAGSASLAPAPPSMLWLCLPAASGSGWRLSAIELARLRRAGRDGVPPVTHLDPCTSSSLPDSICEDFEVNAVDPATQVAFAPHEMAFSLGDFVMWIHGVASGHDVLSALVNPQAFGQTVPPFLVPGIDLGAGAVPASASSPLTGAFEATGVPDSLYKGGAWLLLADDSIGRFMVQASGTTASVVKNAALSVPRPAGIPPGLHPTAVANELTSNAVWRTWDTGNSGIVDRTWIDRTGNTTLPCGQVTAVATRAQGIAVLSFTHIIAANRAKFFGTAWLSGDDDVLIRVRAPFTPSIEPGHCSEPMAIEYGHDPDKIGNSLLNPGGRSLTAGGS